MERQSRLLSLEQGVGGLLLRRNDIIWGFPKIGDPNMVP